ncbi:MAG: DNA adenine methylase [Ruminococcus sp.]|nr:DNA adenine methylase [Ruminococcus sp.]
MKYKTVKPFVKWAGGKSQLLNDIRAKYPEKIDKYCEPFVGGGAVLLDVLANCRPKEVLINDINAELANTYAQIKNSVDELIEMLSEMQKTFWEKNDTDRKIMYLAKRERFNDLKVNGDEQINLEKAALFIFLNKTCFNGLYRVNRKGLFNVPIGSYKKPPICDAENLRLISGLLKNVQIKCGDYSKCADFIDENTFVYIDPPYRPLTATASFTSYSENEFGDKQQIELGKFVDEISAKGAKVLISNSDPKNSDESDSFFDDLYSSYTIMRVSAKRMINSKATGRGSVNELLICNC